MKVTVSKESKNKNKRCFSSPMRFFNKFGDLYVKIMSKWANHLESTGVNVTTLPRSFSVSSSRLSSGDQDLVELMRIASRRGLAKKVESEFLRQKGLAHGSTRMNDGLHSRSVGVMGKIDEDESFDFGGGNDFKINGVNFARSRSHVGLTRNNGMF
ncbi:unnamed protein product [Lactuca virosa]|uniref:Uncharacterized protein n=1 Tax=Lactuca virosa TaxID=75947 RepID=A0AAU9LY68_9ASTR|nr:unnamed protein product [Lactuca virosa]